MELIAIKERPEENEALGSSPFYQEMIQHTIDFYKRVGFMEPWIGYFAKKNGHLVAAAGFKGQPIDGTVEIAYGTFEEYQNQGIGIEVCRHLVELALKKDPAIKITARTLPEENYSTRILKKNSFIFMGTVTDPEDGEVWEWLYKQP